MSVPRMTETPSGPSRAWWRVQSRDAEHGPALPVTAAVLAVATVVSLSLQAVAVPRSDAFTPVMLVSTGLLLGLSALVLLGDYRDRGDVRLLMTGAAYLGSLVVLVGAALAIPGAFTTDPPLATTDGVGALLRTSAVLLLGLGLGLSWTPWPAPWAFAAAPRQRRLVLALTLSATVVLAATVVTAVVFAAPHVATWRSEPVDVLVAVLAVLVVTAALAAVLLGTGQRTGPERWSCLVVFACLGSLALGVGGPIDGSVGWYAAQALTLVGSSLLMFGWLGDARRVKTQAEHDAAFDPLTGLPNRRSGMKTLEQTLARSRRAGSPLAMLMVEIDAFEEVNVRHGFDAGDAALAAVGQQLVTACRTGDVVARLGGQEFLVLLPDTKDRGALIVADKIRSAVALEPILAIGVPLTVSIGATTLQIHDLDPNEMLVRARTALYKARTAGCNRIVLLAGMTDDDLLGAL